MKKKKKKVNSGQKKPKTTEKFLCFDLQKESMNVRMLTGKVSDTDLLYASYADWVSEYARAKTYTHDKQTTRTTLSFYLNKTIYYGGIVTDVVKFGSRYKILLTSLRLLGSSSKNISQLKDAVPFETWGMDNTKLGSYFPLVSDSAIDNHIWVDYKDIVTPDKTYPLMRGAYVLLVSDVLEYHGKLKGTKTFKLGVFNSVLLDACVPTKVKTLGDSNYSLSSSTRKDYSVLNENYTVTTANDSKSLYGVDCKGYHFGEVGKKGFKLNTDAYDYDKRLLDEIGYVEPEHRSGLSILACLELLFFEVYVHAFHAFKIKARLKCLPSSLEGLKEMYLSFRYPKLSTFNNEQRYEAIKEFYHKDTDVSEMT